MAALGAAMAVTVDSTVLVVLPQATGTTLVLMLQLPVAMIGRRSLPSRLLVVRHGRFASATVITSSTICIAEIIFRCVKRSDKTGTLAIWFDDRASYVDWEYEDI